VEKGLLYMSAGMLIAATAVAALPAMTIGGLGSGGTGLFGGAASVTAAPAAVQSTVTAATSVAAVARTPTGQALVQEVEEVAAVEAPAIARTFTSSDPLVGELATKIEKAYPGHVLGVNVDVFNRMTGQKLTDIDILLKNAAIQVKSGTGKGMLDQMRVTEAQTGLPTIGYGPDLRGAVVKSIQHAGGLVTRSAQEVIDVVRP
jgi:hypothetical protein